MSHAPKRFLTTALPTCIWLLAGMPSHRDGIAPGPFAQDRGAPIILLGIGASFPAPLYERRFSEYNDSRRTTLFGNTRENLAYVILPRHWAPLAGLAVKH
jgi:hypothetical protein